MKKLLLVIIILLTMFMSQNVYAEDVIAYEIGNNKYIIDKFAIRVYPLDEENGQVSNETFIKYQTNQFAKEIDIPNVTIDPRGYKEKIEEFDTQFVSLNTNITEDMVRNLLSTEISSVSATRSYIAEVVVYYKLYETDEKYKKFYVENAYKAFLKGFMSSTGGSDAESFTSQLSDNYAEVQKTDTIAQVINLISINQNEFKYASTAEGTDPLLSLYNFLGLAEQDKEIEEPKELVIFTNISDLQYFVTQLKELYKSGTDPDDPADPADPTPPPEQPTVPENPHTSVNIPDTALDKSQIAVIIGIVMIIAGLGATYIVFRKTN